MWAALYEAFRRMISYNKIWFKGEGPRRVVGNICPIVSGYLCDKMH